MITSILWCQSTFLVTVEMRIANAWSDHGTTKYQYIPGTLLVDVLWITRALVSAQGTATPNRLRCIDPQSHGEMYCEVNTPHYLVPDAFERPPFFAQQLIHLHNHLALNEADGTENDSKTLPGWFLRLLGPALQGNGDLVRHVSQAMRQIDDLKARVLKSISRFESADEGDDLRDVKRTTILQLESLAQRSFLCRVNPLLASFVLLDAQLRFCCLGVEAVRVSKNFGGFCHAYSALVQCNLVKAVPSLEKALDLFERFIFVPSRADATHGAFTRSFLRSLHMTPAVVEAVLRRRPIPRIQAARDRVVLRMQEVSVVMKLLANNDYTVFTQFPGSMATWKTMLGTVSKILSSQVYETSVLSQDILGLSDDATCIMRIIHRVMTNDYLRGMNMRGRPQHANEDALVIFLLSILDNWKPDGSVHFAEDAPMLLGMRGRGMLDSEKALRCCKLAAQLIEATRFESHFTCPSSPKWIPIEYGHCSFVEYKINDGTMDQFLVLMEKLAESQGPLFGDDLIDFKNRIIADPAVLIMTWNHFRSAPSFIKLPPERLTMFV